MKRNLIKLLLCIALVCITAFFFTACGGDNTGNGNNADNNQNQDQNQDGDNTDDRDSQIVAIYNLYVANAEVNGQTPLTYEEWLISIKGEKGETGATGPQGPQGEQGPPGKDGADGVSVEQIFVGEDGHLYVKLTGDASARDLGLLVPPSAEQDGFSKGLEYCPNSDKTGYAIMGVGICLDKDIKISNTYLGKPVTEIKGGAFLGENLITSIEIPDSVTSIGSSAFEGCTKLTSVAIPNSVASIGSSAFKSCASLTSVVIGNSVTNIGYWAFSGCTSLKRVDYTGTIDQWAQIEFRDNSSNPLYYAKNLYIDGELVTEAKITTATEISDYAFEGYDTLTSVEIGDSVTSIGYRAFYGCPSLQYNEKDGLKYLGNENIKYLYLAGVVSQEVNAVAINDNCRFIGSYAFFECTSLESVEIGDSVTSIGSSAFYNCTSLTSIKFNGTVEEWNAIEKGSFWDYNDPATKVICADGEVDI